MLQITSPKTQKLKQIPFTKVEAIMLLLQLIESIMQRENPHRDVFKN